MAAGSRTDSDAGQAEKLHRIAEERFLAGDVAGSLRVAREAEARCGSLQGFHALAAYEVHAAAAVRNWYGILGVGSRGSVTHEDIKRRYRRLCLVLHPDKNRSAAADGAFKLLQEAWTALSARHPPLKPRTAPSQSPREPSTTTGARRPRSPASAEKPSNHSPPPPAASDTFCSRKPRRGAPPPRTFRSVYCGHCDREFYAADDDDGKQKDYCVLCGEQLSDPRRPTAAGSETLRRRRRENGSFSCPGQCPRCGERDAYKPRMVPVLRCVSCHHQGPKSSRSGLY